ncbi:hypothetical protein RchiOBHm_Chr5g0081571 [Rosa chinensis]|uniref:DUF538 domain-containing protein n=1 Tax=Rosa chinensis TaxID=74649 RepID=A0A2P6QN21_ROSCH|nr:uncharacterized protein LOC112164929 [Rosa chinensis]PRQ35582.1 hypothetical protein RchiOBHm_Chr5g0081571 [Rosa chinensis]
MAPFPKPHPGLIPILLLLLLSTAASPSLSLSSDSSASVFELLPKYGLPSGLLPASVSNYTLSADDGRFVVVLEKPCYIQFEYLVYYETRITGKLSYGAITELKGIQVQRLFFWFDVDEIRVDLPPSDSIYFTVGIINKKLDVDQFQSVHSCRDGLSGSGSGSCLGSLKRVIQLPSPLEEEIKMLLTE